ncbi:hypothetical protein Psyaliredsea_06610 [Psychrobacter alimentarius]
MLTTKLLSYRSDLLFVMLTTKQTFMINIDIKSMKSYTFTSKYCLRKTNPSELKLTYKKYL